MTPATHEYRLNVRAAGKDYSLDFRQAFRFGYTLVRTRRFKEAGRVFEALAQVKAGGRQAAILLAYCRAGLRDYAGSNTLLCQTFGEGDAKAKADQLHTAFVYMSVGMWKEAVEELAALARVCPDLPVICLLLGDLFALLHKRTKAILSWRIAVARDDAGGAVAAVARQLVLGQTGSHKSKDAHGSPQLRRGPQLRNGREPHKSSSMHKSP